MKFPNLLIIVLFISTESFCSEIIFPEGKKSGLTVSTGYSFASDAITNEFAEAYYLRKFISDDLKDAVTRKLRKSNRLGAEFNYGIEYSGKTDSMFNLPNSFFSFSFRNIQHIDAKFSRDLFELYFRGNKPFAGDIANLSDFGFNHLVYQQFKFRFGHWRKQEDFAWMAGISLIKGQRFQHMRTDEAFLFTPKSGEYLDLDAEIDLRQQDSARSSLEDWNGTGTAIDFSLIWKSATGDRFVFSVENAGLIAWNDRSSYVSADSAFRFEGIDVTDLFDFGDSVRDPISLDSSFVQPFLDDRTNESFITPLPLKVSASFTALVGKNESSINTGLKYVFFANARPAAWMKYNHAFSSHHMLSVKAQYGGYTTWVAGLSYSALIGSWRLTLESDFLSERLSPREGTAQDAFVSLTKYF